MKILYFIVSMLLIIACEKTDKNTFSYSGDFSGHIYGDSLHWYDGTHNVSNVKIIFNRGDQIFETTCDSEGDFKFSNIPYGTYNITLIKDGYVSTYIPGYQIFFTDPIQTDGFYIFKKKYITTIRVDKILYEGLYFHQLICSGSFSENERVEFIIFINEKEKADYTNYTDFMYVDNNYNPDFINYLFLGVDAPDSDVYYAIYPVLGFNYPYTNWHSANNIRQYPVVFDNDIFFEGFYDKNSSHVY
ncbi:carboxypeptidase-like regulatory domain-containing protein [Saccharicrinis sp. FJH62]|uniref:carboxypeptidase-like regulatory domain-containing protein n=1 Tax=Saccharicrinis sp. FJH62 TaxID=3344657 RepID=UPI0035D42150